MASKERQDQIKQIIQRNKKVVISELSAKFNVTEETIRRDLEKFENDGFIVRTYGGAVLSSNNVENSIEKFDRSQINANEKRIIAETIIASGIIPVGATILADKSSTVMETLRRLGDRGDLTILLHSLENAQELEKTQLNLVLTGGIIDKKTRSLQGIFAQNTIQSCYVDSVLVGCASIRINDGVFDTYGPDAELKRLMISQGKKVIFLADHTKFQQNALVKLCDFENVDVFVTDRKPTQEWMEAFEKSNVRVLYPMT